MAQGTSTWNIGARGGQMDRDPPERNSWRRWTSWECRWGWTVNLNKLLKWNPKLTLWWLATERSGKLPFLNGMTNENSTRRILERAGSTKYQSLEQSTATNSKWSSGTQPDKRNSELLPTSTSRTLMASSSPLTSPKVKASSMLNSGSYKYTKTPKRGN